jgi:UDP-N-acetylglucosamine:LPS N-acetylglucosamine transferase
MIERPQKIAAVSSGGGHWVQLLRLRPAFEGHEVVFMTVNRSYQDDVKGQRLLVVPDATRWNKVRLVWAAAQIFRVLLRERPDVIVSTGAAPGYLAVRMGKWLGSRTVWVDSIANVETLSLSGQRIGRFADLWLTQWSHLARPQGPFFKGTVV